MNVEGMTEADARADLASRITDCAREMSTSLAEFTPHIKRLSESLPEVRKALGDVSAETRQLDNCLVACLALSTMVVGLQAVDDGRWTALELLASAKGVRLQPKARDN